MHTKKEFMAIMKRVFLDSTVFSKIYGSSFDPVRLRKMSFHDWVKWAGASIISDSGKYNDAM